MRRINKILAYACTAVLLPFLFLSGCSPSSDYLVEIPGDFKVVAVTGGVAPGEPILKLEIDAQGDCIYSESRGKDRVDGVFKQVETFTIPSAGMHFIHRAVRTNDFFGLSPEYINSSVLDGNFALLTITENKRTHSARTQNIKVARFDNIMIAINIAVPGMNKVMYNQISWFETGRE